MLAGIKKYGKLLLMSFLVFAGFSIATNQQHVYAVDDTNRNEQFAAAEYNVPISGVSTADGYVKIYENKNFEYFFSAGSNNGNKNKNILKIRNKQTGFVWSTGAGNSRKDEMLSRCTHIRANTPEYFACTIDAGPNKNGGDNEAAYAEINQLLGFSYINKGQPTPNVGLKALTAEFVRHEKYANRWMFKTSFQVSIDKKTRSFNFNMRFTFDEKGFNVDILEEDIYGSGSYLVDAVYPLPCFGQSGGNMLTCSLENVDEDGYGDCAFYPESITKNPATDLPGYVFIPDGSGALIRYDTNREMNNNELYFDVYGDPYREKYTDVEYSTGDQIMEHSYVDSKKIMMPVWGVSYGNNQDAFVAYATHGSEYFGLVFRGRSDNSSKFAYSQTKPRFERNRTYKYNFGAAARTILYLEEDEIYKYDIGLRYDILSGDGSLDSLPANYIGMALSYRNYLVNNGLIKKLTEDELHSGVKVDFIMSDVKRAIVGYEDVIATHTNRLQEILNEFKDMGIDYVTSSLLGWQNDGIAMAHPGKNNYSTGAGSKSGFRDVVNTAKKLDYDINFQQNYGLINSDQMPNIGAYAVKGLNRNYGTMILWDNNKPVKWWHYANPNMQMTWLNNQTNTLLDDFGKTIGVTIEGTSNILAPDYGKNLSYEDSMKIIANGTYKASSKARLGAVSPNMYLWPSLTDYYDIPVYNSQYIAETDSVPFLEIVLGGLVNLYASYSNFSFYNDESCLKMIEYNLNPSFIITEQSNEDLMYTNSRDYYSTGYGKYKEIIKEVYEKVNPILTALKGKTLVGREVIPTGDDNDNLGFYVNTYAPFVDGAIQNDSKVVVAINYQNYEVTYEGHVVKPMSAMIIS